MSERNQHAATPVADQGAGQGAGLPLWLAFVLLVIASASWAGSSVAGRAAAGSVPPYALSFLRWLGATILFLPLGLRPLWRERAHFLRHWPLMVAFSFFGVTGFSVPYFAALQATTAVNVSILNASAPIITVILSFAMVGILITRGQLAGIALAFAGALVIMIRGDLAVLATLRLNIGDVLSLAAFLAWCMYTVMLRWKPAEIGTYSFLLAIAALGCVSMAPMFAWELAQGRSFAPTANNWFIIGYTSVFPSFVAYICWNKAVPVVGANIAAISQYLNPVFGVIFAMAILSEGLESYHLAGIAAIFAGLYLSTALRRGGDAAGKVKR